MICDHSTETDLVLDNKYVLIHCGGQFMAGDFTTNKVTSRHMVEVFDTAQELIDRGLELGLECSPRHAITAMEHGAVLPPDVMAGLNSLNLDWDLAKRLEALEL